METTTEYVEFARDGSVLRGMLHAPKTDRAVPGVLFLHGLGGNRIGSDYILVRAARMLAAREIASLRFDFGGCGESDGMFEDTTAAAQVLDALAALEVLKTRARVDTERLGVYGHSFGGCIAALLLAEVPFVSAALFAAVASPMRLLVDRGEEEVERALREDGYVPHNALRLGPSLVAEARSCDPVAGIAASKAEVLVLHGDEDERVDLDHACMFEKALTGRPDARTEIEVVPGLAHSAGTPAQQDFLLGRVGAWFERTLVRREG